MEETETRSGRRRNGRKEGGGAYRFFVIWPNLHHGLPRPVPSLTDRERASLCCVDLRARPRARQSRIGDGNSEGGTKGEKKETRTSRIAPSLGVNETTFLRPPSSMPGAGQAFLVEILPRVPAQAEKSQRRREGLWTRSEPA